MRSFAIVALAVGLAACGDREVERLTEIKVKVCACKTASCAEQEIKAAQDGKPNGSATHRAQTIARDMVDCLARLQAAERPAESDEASEAEHEHGAEDEVPDLVPRIVPGAAAK